MALTKISTGGVKDDAASQAKIADEAIDEARLQVSNAGTNGQFLQKQSGNTGGLTWATATTDTSDKAPINNPTFTGIATSPQIDIRTGSSINVNSSGASASLGLYKNTNSGEAAIVSSGTGGANYLNFYTSNSAAPTAKLRINWNGAIGIGGANYGSSGQVLTSGGSGAAPSWAAVPPGGNTFTAVANGSIANNKPVKLDTDGKVSEIKESLSPLSTFTNNGDDVQVGGFNNGTFHDVCYDVANDGIWTIYCVGNANNSINVGFYKIQNSVGGLPFWISAGGSNYVEVTIDMANNSENPRIEYDPDTERAVAIWITSGGAVESKVLQYNSSNNTVTQGSEVTVFSSGGLHATMCYDTTNNKMIVGAVDTGNSSRFQTRVGTVTGGSTNSISFGSTTYNTAETGSGVENRATSLVHDPDNDKIVLYVKLDGGAWSNDGAICVYTYDSSAGTIVIDTCFNLGGNHYAGEILYDPNVNKFLIWFTNTGASSIRYTRVITISGTTVSAGSLQSQQTPTGTGNNGYGNQAMTFDPISNKFIFFFFEDGNDDLQFTSGAISGTTISLASPTNIDTSNIYRSANFPGMAGTYTKNGQHIFFHRQSNAGNKIYLRNVLTASVNSNLTDAEKYVGFADQAYTNGQTATISTYGNSVNTLSGMTIGSPYYVQGDGSIATTVDSSLSLGSNRPLAGTALSATKLLIRDPLAKT